MLCFTNAYKFEVEQNKIKFHYLSCELSTPSARSSGVFFKQIKKRTNKKIFTVFGGAAGGAAGGPLPIIGSAQNFSH